MAPAGAIEVGQNCQSGASDYSSAAKASGVWRILAENGRAEFSGRGGIPAQQAPSETLISMAADCGMVLA